MIRLEPRLGRIMCIGIVSFSSETWSSYEGLKTKAGHRPYSVDFEWIGTKMKNCRYLTELFDTRYDGLFQSWIWSIHLL